MMDGRRIADALAAAMAAAALASCSLILDAKPGPGDAGDTVVGEGEVDVAVDSPDVPDGVEDEEEGEPDCTATGCAAGEWCRGRECVRCADDRHCGAGCDDCAGIGMQCNGARSGCAAPGVDGGFVAIPAGSFFMGSPPGEPGRESEGLDETLHLVTLTVNYEIMDREVTQAGLETLLGYNPSRFEHCGRDCPAENVTWHEALAFANAMSRGRGLPECFDCEGEGAGVVCVLEPAYARPQDCPGFRLPTEAEWEYAARAGSGEPFANGEIAVIADTCGAVDEGLDEMGWYCANSGASFTGCEDLSGHFGGPACAGPHPVGGKKPNRWGVHDMHGNVYEWTWDWYGSYDGPATDPVGPVDGEHRVIRGGSWWYFAKVCRSAFRYRFAPDGGKMSIGLRLVRSLPGSAGFVPIHAGTFWMGSPEDESGRDADETRHEVTLTVDYEMMSREATQAAFEALVMRNPSHFSSGWSRPVETVSWHEALLFANRMSMRDGLPECFDCEGATPDVTCGLKPVYTRPQDCPGYRLPTEAEWERAARAGTATAFSNGPITSTECSPLDEILHLIAWYCANAAGETWPGGIKRPNGWGLYDMSGNVWEWVWDWLGEYPGSATDYYGPSSGSFRVVRGGSWNHMAKHSRSASRTFLAGQRSDNVGIRLVRSLLP